MVFQMEGFFRYKQFENEVMAYRGFLADQVNSSYYEDQRMLNQTSLLNSFSNSWKNHYDLIYVANVILEIYIGQRVFRKISWIFMRDRLIS